MTVKYPNVGIELGKAVLAIALLVVASGVFLLLVAMGPLGWFTLVILGLGLSLALSSWHGKDDENEADRPDRTNCPNCGARITTDSERCDYCNHQVSVSG